MIFETLFPNISAQNKYFERKKAFLLLKYE